MCMKFKVTKLSGAQERELGAGTCWNNSPRRPLLAPQGVSCLLTSCVSLSVFCIRNSRVSSLSDQTKSKHIFHNFLAINQIITFVILSMWSPLLKRSDIHSSQARKSLKQTKTVCFKKSWIMSRIYLQPTAH